MAAVVLQTPIVSSSYNSTATTRTLASVVVAAGSNLCLAVCVQMEATASAVSGITFNSVALTKLDSQVGASFSRSEIWYLINPTVTTANVVVTHTSSDHSVVGALVASGVDQVTGLRTAAKSTGSSTSVTNTVVGVGVDDLVFDSLCIDGTGHLTAPGAGQTEQWDLEPAAGSTTGVTDTQPGSVDGVMSHTWTTSSPFSHVASAFIAAAGSVAGVHPFNPVPFMSNGRI